MVKVKSIIPSNHGEYINLYSCSRKMCYFKSKGLKTSSILDSKFTLELNFLSNRNYNYARYMYKFIMRLFITVNLKIYTDNNKELIK